MSKEAGMPIGSTKTLPLDYDAITPDGAEVRHLLRTPSYSTVHYRLKVGQITLAFRNLTVEEFWYFLSGRGEVWRSDGATSDITAVASGVCLTIPIGTAFQIRCIGDEPLDLLGFYVPAWPADTVLEPAQGPWTATPPPIRHP
jgi:mannose-6-phosphate isomerase-like protein (cupin superfamily)